MRPLHNVQQYGDEEIDFETRKLRVMEIEKKFTEEINKFGLANVVFFRNDKNKRLH